LKVESVLAGRKSVVKQAESPFETRLLAELPVLLRVACRMTKNTSIAEDLVGQTVLQALTHREQFQGRFMRSWLIRIMHRLHWRDRRSTKSLETIPLTAEVIDEKSVWPTVRDRVFEEVLLIQLDCLPEEFRLALALCDMEGLSYEEASVALSIPIGTVRSRLSRGRKLLRQRLENLHWIDHV
jgi:RNA polymerase sigma-70 factor (ECF subfamily)